MSTSILDEYAPKAQFAEDNNICERTVDRYRNEPNGLPFAEFGGRIYIHVPGAREWLARRTKQLNPRRSAA